MATPPPRAVRANTPPTPLHGPRYGNYDPYSPRRSTRASAHNNPYSSFNGERSPIAHRAATPPPTAKKTRFARAPTQLSSPPSSPASPARHRTPRSIHHKTPRKDPFASHRSRPAATNGALSDSDGPSHSLALPIIDPTTMLPTPSKTPKKRQAAVTTTARILNFQPADPNDVMPSPRQMQKLRRKPGSTIAGFELYEDDGMRHNGDDSIEIYTDARARVPQVDESEDNPFVGPRQVRQRPQRKSRKSAAQMAHDAQIDEAARKDEGVTYVFRGRKIFRRFHDGPASEQASSAGSEISGTHEQRQLKRQAGAAAKRPLTRSAIKPRLLFPSEAQVAGRQRGADDADEEAVTDIEMGDAQLMGQGVEETPLRDTAAAHVRFAEASAATPPPTVTGRAMRSSRKVSPVKPTNGALSASEAEVDAEAAAVDASFESASMRSKGKAKAKSPFDSWPRQKAGKRRAEGAALEGPAAGKRTRGTMAGAVESPA